MDDIKEVFDKKSPIFIITISIFITAIVARGQSFNQACIYTGQLRVFETLLIIFSGMAILFKTVAILIIKKCCSARISTLHNLIVFGLLLIDLGMYAWSLCLYISMQAYQECRTNEPHHFLLQVYAVLYSFLYVVLLIIIVSIRFQNKTMTVFQRKSIRDDEQI